MAVYKIKLTPKQKIELESGIIDPRVEMNDNPKRENVDLAKLVQRGTSLSMSDTQFQTLIDWVHDLLDRDQSKKIAKGIQKKIDVEVERHGMKPLRWEGLAVPKLQRETKMNMVGVQAERVDDFEPNTKKRMSNSISNGGGGDVRHNYKLKGESDMNEHMDDGVGPWIVKYSKDGEQEIDRFKDGDKAKEYAEMMRGQGYDVDVSSVNESKERITMKKSELKKIIQECIIEEQNAMMIEEGFFDVFRNLKGAFKTKLYNDHFKKNPEEWLKYLEKIESITKQEQMKKYAGDRQKIDRMLKRIKLLVKQNEFDEALKLSKMLDKSLDKFKNMKAFQQ